MSVCVFIGRLLQIDFFKKNHVSAIEAISCFVWASAEMLPICKCGGSVSVAFLGVDPPFPAFSGFFFARFTWMKIGKFVRHSAR